MFVAVRSEHGHPVEVQIFDEEDEAREFAMAVVKQNGFEKKSGTVEHDGHSHESHWLEDWGDEDGCGIVVGEAHDHDHEHDHQH